VSFPLPTMVGRRRTNTVQRRKDTPDQIVRKLREAVRLVAEGAEVATVARHLEVSEQTYHRWRAQYGGMKADDAKRLRELERENAQLKRIVADKGAADRRAEDHQLGKILSPGRRRAAVHCLQEQLGVSERWACLVVGQSRTTQRRRLPSLGQVEQHLRARLRELARAHPRYGYRRMTTLLTREGFCVNHKRIQRLCRDEGLRVVSKAKKRSRVGISTINGTRLRATHPDEVSAIDYQFDQTTDIKTLRLLSITDEFMKEALAIEVQRSITADDTVMVLERLVAVVFRVIGPTESSRDVA
jgi:hypothetical protein